MLVQYLLLDLVPLFRLFVELKKIMVRCKAAMPNNEICTTTDVRLVQNVLSMEGTDGVACVVKLSGILCHGNGYNRSWISSVSWAIMRLISISSTSSLMAYM